MVNVLNESFDSYCKYLASALEGGSLAIGSSTITVNLEGLRDDSRQFEAAKTAMGLWSSLTGLTFVAAEGGRVADITFSNDQSDEASTFWVDGKAHIDIARNWMESWPESQQWSIGSYGLQTFIHEIGHALGLSHGGPYNGDATYATDRLFDIDTWQYSIMSYFYQGDYAANHASSLFLDSPMIADIAAIAKLYGNLAANAGNTAYGTGSQAMLGVTDFVVHPDAAFAIRDTGGQDLIDLQSLTRSCMLDLRPGSFSDINGYAGNVAITADTIIEDARGGAGADTLIGNDVANRLEGGAGNDTIIGGNGDDVLVGGRGIDTMRGGRGDDTYEVSDATDAIDEVSDAGSGQDTVRASVSFSLDSTRITGAVENLSLTGTASIDAAGNDLNNVLTGNAGANRLSGGDGDDILIGLSGSDTLSGGRGTDVLRGGSGNDRYIVESASDRIDELSDDADGIDTVQANMTFSLASVRISGAVENLVLSGNGNINGSGNGLDNMISGNAGSNSLYGGAGNDVLSGGAGRDTLVGGSGRDVFLFGAPLDGRTNVDRILDFRAVDDTIYLDDQIFTRLGAGGRLAATAFVRTASGRATDGKDRIIYDTDDGSLFYDPDGTGVKAAIKFAVLAKGLQLTASDFFVG